MSIKFHPHHAVFDPRTDAIRIPATVNNRLVVCAIAHEAIRKVLRFSDGPEAYLIETYRRFQRAFHTLAIYKYRANLMQPDGVLSITASDFPSLDAPWDYNKPPTIN
jgi:hypothetical protein